MSLTAGDIGAYLEVLPSLEISSSPLLNVHPMMSYLRTWREREGRNRGQ